MRSEKKQPNILLILTDQHRLSALGCYGTTPCRTPNIDRLAAEGVRFETAYTACPVCTPARASIMSGQYPHRHGMTMNSGSFSSLWNIPDHPRMLSRRLMEQNYRCGYIGKWHLCPSAGCVEWHNHPMPHHLPQTLGFEGQNFPGHGGGGFGYAEYRDYLKERGLEFRLRPDSENPPENRWPNFAVQEGPRESTVDYFLAENTISLIDRFQTTGQPFFIWHNHWGPHEPYYPLAEYYEQYRHLEIQPWPNFTVPDGLLQAQHGPEHKAGPLATDWSYWEKALRHYYAFTTQIDDQIGRIYKHLEQTGVLDDTIIIFSSDHGEAIGSHGGMMNKGYSHFEEIQRIGMIIRYPDKFRPAGIESGTVRREFASLADIYPTCLEIAGVAEPEHDAQGLSLHGLLNGRIHDWRDTLFVEFFGLHAPTAMITCRRGDWKYGWNVNSTDELYNLAEDPHELCNRWGEPELEPLCRELREAIAQQIPLFGTLARTGSN